MSSTSNRSNMYVRLLACLVVVVILVRSHAFVFPERRRYHGSAPRSSTATFAKPKTNKKIPDDLSKQGEDVSDNLTKKIRASRPTLGHVVPKDARLRQKGGSNDPALRPQGKARRSGSNNPSNLKILGGSARGRRLDSPDVYLRPMMGKVREAVFSTFTSFGLYDAADASNSDVPTTTRHLDMFAGSGSVGIESLSRGAAHCTFVDLSRDCCDAVERNLELCRFDDRGAVACGDVFSVLSEPEKFGIEGTFDIVTLCPPYEEIVYADLLKSVANTRLIREDSVVLIEYPVELGCLPHVLSRDTEGDEGKLIGVRNRRYGRTVIAMYVANPTGYLEVAGSRPEEFVF